MLRTTLSSTQPFRASSRHPPPSRTLVRVCEESHEGVNVKEPVNESSQSTSRKESSMQLGMIGLGRMGANMVRRLLKGGHRCVVFDRSPTVVKELTAEKADGAASLADLVKKLEK